MLLLFWSGAGGGPVPTPSADLIPAEQVICMIARPYDDSIETAIEGPHLPRDAAPKVGDRDFSLLGAESQVFASDAGYVSRASDTPANTYFPPILKKPWNFVLQLWDGDRPGQRSKPGAGACELDARDGALDTLLDLGWDGRKIEMYRGLRTAAFSSFTRVFRGVAAGIARADEATLEITLQDQQGVLDKPIQTAFYDGTGGINGTDAVKGKPRPIAMGPCENIAPTPVDATLGLYQISDVQPDGDVLAVRDKGLAVAANATRVFATVELLIAALTDGDLDALSYAITSDRMWLGTGFEPAGQITVDLGGGPTHGDLIRRVLASRLGVDRFVDPDDLYAAMFDALDTAQPAAAQMFISSEEAPSVGDVVDRLLASAGAWSIVDFVGKVMVAVLDDPGGTADDVVQDGDIYGKVLIQRTGAIPPWAIRVGWRRMWAVQSADSLAGGVSPANKQLYANQYRYERASLATALTKHKLSQQVDVAGLFSAQAAAAAEAKRLLALHLPERAFYRFRVYRDAFATRTDGRPMVGGIVEVQAVDRFGFEASRKGILYRVEADLALGETYWTLWL